MDEAPNPGKGAVPLTTSTVREMTMASINLAERDGLIYVITDGCGHYKIGKSNCQGLDQRLAMLQIGNAFRLRVVHQRLCPLDLAFHIELMAHKFLAVYRVRGEWFRSKEDIIVKGVDECVDRGLSMDEALADLIVIAEQQKEIYRTTRYPKTDLQEVMKEDTLRLERLGATIRTTHGSLRGAARRKK